VSADSPSVGDWRPRTSGEKDRGSASAEGGSGWDPGRAAEAGPRRSVPSDEGGDPESGAAAADPAAARRWRPAEDAGARRSDPDAVEVAGNRAGSDPRRSESASGIEPSTEVAPRQATARFTLASGSPRRRELLARVGIHPLVAPVEVDETPLDHETPVECVLRLARAKANASPAPVALAADTVVALDGHILGKPRDRDHADQLLRWLSGRTHRVHSAVVLRVEDRSSWDLVTTDVRFRVLLEAEIAHYLDSGEPWDKAGAYGIQGLGGAFVECIDGSYTNVVGLPLSQTLRLLRREGVWSPEDPFDPGEGAS
jgi:septum formation protein